MNGLKKQGKAGDEAVISQKSKDAFLYRIKDWDLNKLTS